MTKTKAMRDTPTEAMKLLERTRSYIIVAASKGSEPARELSADISSFFDAMQAARSETPVQDDDARFTTKEIADRILILSIHFAAGTVGRKTCDLAYHRLREAIP